MNTHPKAECESFIEKNIKKAIELSEFRRTLSERETKFNDVFNQQLDKELLWLKIEAQDLCDEYQQLKNTIKTHRPMNEWGTLEVILKENKQSFAINWQQNRFIKLNGQWRVFRTPMKLNKTTLQFSFRRAIRPKDWEIVQSKLLEYKFCVLRKYLKKVISLKQHTR